VISGLSENLGPLQPRDGKEGYMGTTRARTKNELRDLFDNESRRITEELEKRKNESQIKTPNFIF
jgi:hypothetical protein